MKLLIFLLTIGSAQLFPRPTIIPRPTTTTDCTPRECDTVWDENICGCVKCSSDYHWDTEEWTIEVIKEYYFNIHCSLLLLLMYF